MDISAPNMRGKAAVGSPCQIAIFFDRSRMTSQPPASMPTFLGPSLSTTLLGPGDCSLACHRAFPCRHCSNSNVLIATRDGSSGAGSVVADQPKENPRKHAEPHLLYLQAIH